jgi:hypothetical protein
MLLKCRNLCRFLIKSTKTWFAGFSPVTTGRDRIVIALYLVYGGAETGFCAGRRHFHFQATTVAIAGANAAAPSEETFHSHDSTLHKNVKNLEFSTLLPHVVTIADEEDAQLKEQILRFMAADATNGK